jgi:SAM-dependent methyltransferase
MVPKGVVRSEPERHRRVREVVTLPSQLSMSLEQALLAEFDRTLTPEQIDLVRNLAESDRPLHYQTQAAAFAYLYFGANYSKAYQACRRILERLPRRGFRVLDLGCGSGAASAGVLSALADEGFEIREVCAVDLSAIQLRWYEQIVRPWITRNPNLRLVTAHEDASAFLERDRGGWDLIVGSYLVPELSLPQRDRLMQLLDAPKHRASETLFVQSDADGHPHFHGRLLEGALEGDALKVRLDFLQNIEFPVLPKHAVHPGVIVDSSYSSQILTDYFDAWNKLDADRVVGLFCNDAEYVILDKKILAGQPAIQNYWRYNSINQESVRASVVRRFITHSGVLARWHAEFYRTDKQRWYNLKGLMLLQLASGAIRRLTERYSIEDVASPRKIDATDG